jgi:hypothetical protein
VSVWCAAFIETIEGIKEGLSYAFSQAALYVRDFERYLTVYLHNAAFDVGALKHSKIATLQERLKTFHAQDTDFEKMRTVADIGIIQVDSSKLKEHFLPSPKRCIAEMEKVCVASRGMAWQGRRVASGMGGCVVVLTACCAVLCCAVLCCAFSCCLSCSVSE